MLDSFLIKDTLQFILILLISIILAIFLSFIFAIFFKHYKAKKYSEAYEFWKPKVLELLDSNIPINGIRSNIDKIVILDIILKESESSYKNYSDFILSLGLDKILIANLKTKDNKILAIKNIGISQIPDAYNLLKKFWSSTDFDESYFSIYYTLKFNYAKSDTISVLNAILSADFNSDRKVEMIKKLHLSNSYLINILTSMSNSANVVALISSLDFNSLTTEQLKEIEYVAQYNTDYQIAFALLLIQSNNEHSISILKKYADLKMSIELRISIAYNLSKNKSDSNFKILKALMFDEDWQVQYHAAVNILKYGDIGYNFLESLQVAHFETNAGKMADLQLSINPSTI